MRRLGASPAPRPWQRCNTRRNIDGVLAAAAGTLDGAPFGEPSRLIARDRQSRVIILAPDTNLRVVPSGFSAPVQRAPHWSAAGWVWGEEGDARFSGIALIPRN